MKIQLRKLNIAQVVLVLTPFEWVFFPRKYRVTPDMWVEPAGNYTQFRFLFIDLKVMHINRPDEQENKKKP